MNRWRRFARLAFQPRRQLASLLLVMALGFLAGCVSKKTAEARARAAFLAGQQQQSALMARQTPLQGPTVTVLGEVRNALVPWAIDLTLAKAVIAADYYGRIDPTAIVIRRDGKEISYEPRMLLSGQDVPLEPNDVIELRH